MAAELRPLYDLYLYEEDRARGTSPEQRCREQIERCHVFIGILGNRYGSPLPDDEGQRSIVEWELDTARTTRADLEIMPFVRKGADTGGDPRQASFLARLTDFRTGRADSAREVARRRRLIRTYLALLVVPLAAVAALLLFGRTDRAVVEQEIDQRVRPVEETYSRIEPMLDEVRQVGVPELRAAGDRFRGYERGQSELSEQVEQVAAEIERLRPAVQEATEIRAEMQERRRIWPPSPGGGDRRLPEGTTPAEAMDAGRDHGPLRPPRSPSWSFQQQCQASQTRAHSRPRRRTASRFLTWGAAGRRCCRPGSYT